MATEIERKYLLLSEDWRSNIVKQAKMVQGYLESNEAISIRIRTEGESANINIKSGTLGISRTEYEYSIPLSDATEMLDKMCARPLIEKVRYWVDYQGFMWEVDIFDGENAGLVVAEIELNHEHQSFPMPDWVGQEVSMHKRYYNSLLMAHPYCRWSDDERNPG
ncbi:MAG: CYTH domain-containing protein [Methylococcales bacterium]|jgi:adenylate cyclase|nr:CYTH domain-containing protein [Methylococcales bacterium]MBT7444446.1 CYTH domain-containing protein [Methylococcales bacterium]